MLRLTKLVVFMIVTAAPLGALAHSEPRFRAPIESRPGLSAPTSFQRTLTVPSADGDTVTAFQFSRQIRIGGQLVTNPSGDLTVALARISASGEVRWIRRFAEEAGSNPDHLNGVIDMVPFPDGGVLIDAQIGRPGHGEGALIRFGPDGREVWRLASSLPSGWTSFQPRLDSAGRLVVLGKFYRGEVQLPGVPRMRGHRQFNQFLAEVDPATGAVRWARPIVGDLSQIAFAADDSILVAGWFQRRAGTGRNAVRSRGGMDGLLSRYDSRGRMIQNVAWGTPDNDNILGLAALSGGGAVILTDSYEPIAGEPHRVQRVMRLVGYDRAFHRTFEHALAPDSSHRLAMSAPSDRVVVASVGPLQELRIGDGAAGSGTRQGEVASLHTYTGRGVSLGEQRVSLLAAPHVFGEELSAFRVGTALLVSGHVSRVTDGVAVSNDAFMTTMSVPGMQ